MNCFARLVRVLLGSAALSDDKLGCGPTLEILGVQLFLSALGYKAVPSQKMVTKCLRAIRKALADNSLPSGAAQKLAGRLNWAGQYMFHRLGRAMLRPIYDQRFCKCGFQRCLSHLAGGLPGSVWARIACQARAAGLVVVGGGLAVRTCSVL